MNVNDVFPMMPRIESMRGKSISSCVALTLLLSSVVAKAGPGEDKAAADALFKAGRTLVKQGKFSEACPKLEASHKLDPATGTLLALGDCYESDDIQRRAGDGAESE
jgi:hypothetical protein